VYALSRDPFVWGMIFHSFSVTRILPVTMTGYNATFSTLAIQCSKEARKNTAEKIIKNDFTGNFCSVHITTLMYLYVILGGSFCEHSYDIVEEPI